MSNDFPLYTIDYISGVMSLRKPQTKSLEILAEIMEAVQLRKGMNLKAALGAVHAMYPICSDFERDFMSLTFALATGVGKTRLMGAFIAYLYTQHHIRNFFVVAPNTTIFEKLKKDLSDNNSAKYVFKGLGCFSTPPQIITDDDYREKTLSLFESDVHIFVYNIDKFNKEGANMKKVNELIGDSFYQALSDLPDLVLIMDESHHYRAEKGAQALNELHPLLGLELTATPLVTKGNKQVPFKNVVYEYPLSKAIEDGYTRTPYAVTRSDIDFYNFGDEQLDKMMLLDGITCHESTKRKLEVYAANHGKPVVKPFMLVVCKDTDHATWVEQFVKSDEFRGGAYRNKTIIVHSKQKGAETEANTRLLLDVENPENPVEIVIHVNMLKEGWDVNNLYTIVPLRTAASKILREQMVGRGLRLPYGERTGDRDVDAVMLTAHDKFNDILAEAQKGDSIFKAGNVIKAEEIKPEEVVYTQLTIETDPDVELEETIDAVSTLKKEGKILHAGVSNFSKEQIEEAQKYCEIEAFQPQYSLADRKDEKLIRWAYEQGLGIMTYGTLGGGILTGNYRKLRTFEQTDSRNRFYPYFKEPLFSKAMELLTIMDQIAEERNVSLAQIAEKWVIQKRFVSSCIIGAQSRARVEENCRNLQWELTDNEIRRLESVRIL